MYTVRVRDHVMIAHSFKGEIFGPAQRLHGATFTVDVEFRRAELTDDNIVVDIGRALDVLKTTLGEINYQNLDELKTFESENTTTEFLARWVFDRMRAAIDKGDLGPSARSLASIKVEIGESHVAWAGYESEIG
jgi:6-pyruvoyl-tetrahydropterin synthase